MSRMKNFLSLMLTAMCLPASLSHAQMGGTRAGVEQTSQDLGDLPRLDKQTIESFISIDGRAEIRVQPTEVRIVLAITSEGKSAQQCQASIVETAKKLNQAWSGLGISNENIVEDFIAILPVYEWNLEKRNAKDVGVQKQVGYRMQTNIHLAVPNDATAPKAVEVAFEQGVTDIIAFDYWCKELDDYKVKAREQALKAARSKSDMLLSTLFTARPPAINLQENTTVLYPESLYHSVVNVHEDEVTYGWRNDMPMIRAYRPRNTYYRGLYSNGDVQARELPMKPEISVVSTVRLYFESPAKNRASKEDSKDTK